MSIPISYACCAYPGLELLLVVSELVVSRVHDICCFPKVVQLSAVLCASSPCETLDFREGEGMRKREGEGEGGIDGHIIISTYPRSC